MALSFLWLLAVMLFIYIPRAALVEHRMLVMFIACGLTPSGVDFMDVTCKKNCVFLRTIHRNELRDYCSGNRKMSG